MGAYTNIRVYDFSAAWDGIYTQIDRGMWFNGNAASPYYLYRDFENWKICNSRYVCQPVEAIPSLGHLKAIKAFTVGSTPAGNYTGVDGNPNGKVELVY